MFSKRGVLRNFTKFTGKHQCQSLFFNKVAGLRPVTLLKKRLWHRCFPVNFVKFLRIPFFIEHLWWLLLQNQKNWLANVEWSYWLCALVMHIYKIIWGQGGDICRFESILKLFIYLIENESNYLRNVYAKDFMMIF